MATRLNVRRSDGDAPSAAMGATPDIDSGAISTGSGRRGLWIGLGVAALLVVIGLYFALGHKPASSPGAKSGDGRAAPAAPRVTVARVGRSSVTTDIQVTGTIAARNTLPVGVEGEGGRVTAVLVEAGEHVRAGQLLARISADVIDQQVAQLRAGLDEARANATLAAADSERAKALGSRGALSGAEIDRRQANARAMAARTDNLNAQLKEMLARKSRLEVRAPAAGIILERNVEVGQIAGAGGGWMFRLAKDGAIELRGRVAEQDLPSLSVGQAARVQIAGSRQTFSGRVWQLGPTIDPETRLGTVRIALTPHPMLRPGAFAQGFVVASSAERPVVPLSSVQADGSNSYVLTVGPDNTLARRDIRVLRASSAGVVVDKGLNGDEEIVLTAAAFLNPGEKIIPDRSQASASAPTAPAGE